VSFFFRTASFNIFNYNREDFRDYFTTSDANFAAAFVFFVDSPDHSYVHSKDFFFF